MQEAAEGALRVDSGYKGERCRMSLQIALTDKNSPTYQMIAYPSGLNAVNVNFESSWARFPTKNPFILPPLSSSMVV